MDLIKFINEQKAFSENTFGPGKRTEGIVTHIRKELLEVLEEPSDLEEWVDVILLSLDGAWRSGHSAEEITDGMTYKLGKNKRRTWPNWETLNENDPIEHDRSKE